MSSSGPFGRALGGGGALRAGARVLAVAFLSSVPEPEPPPAGEEYGGGFKGVGGVLEALWPAPRLARTGGVGLHKTLVQNNHTLG